jgi:hypothetical protein
LIIVKIKVDHICNDLGIKGGTWNNLRKKTTSKVVNRVWLSFQKELSVKIRAMPSCVINPKNGSEAVGNGLY